MAPRIWLRLEGVAALGAALWLWEDWGAWKFFALLFFLPDLSMLGYLGGPQAGALAYNLAHTYLAPALLAALGAVSGEGVLLQVALIWMAHIGFDRALGYGLKLRSGFHDTHLGVIGKPRRATEGGGMDADH